MLLMPPVHRLPVELLSHIFVDLDSIRIHEDSIGRKYVSDKGPHRLQTTAARVCRRWRSVALATSLLWSFISVGDDTRYVEAYIDACATNSGNHQLTLWCISSECLPIFLSRLLPHRSRWESLNIDGGQNIAFSALSSQYEFRILRAVKLNWFLPLKSGMLDFLTNAPQLRVLEIWDSMTEDSLRIPNLTNLVEVYFHADEPCTCHVFTRFIVAPALVKLEIRDAPIAESLCDSIDVLMSHPQAEPPALRSLVLDGIAPLLDEGDDRAILRCLARVPNLEHLHVSITRDQQLEDEGPSINDVVLAELLVKDTGLPLLPALRMFAWAFGASYEGRPDELARRRHLLLDVVRSRMAPLMGGQSVAALQSFTTDVEIPELGAELQCGPTSGAAEHTYIGLYNSDEWN
ncbi:hypothetical protein EV121DRAFT_293017 [Schizophyllum commune]